MRVGIEASAAVVDGRTGVGTYTANLIAGLQRIGESSSGLELVCFSNRQPHTNGSGPAMSFGPDIHQHDQLRSRLLWMQLKLPRSLASTRLDACHFPNYLGPVLRRPDMPCLVTMHDMSVYRCPQYQPAKTVAVHRAIMPILARRVAVIVAVSHSAKQEILSYLKVPPERVRVVYEGIGAQFRPRAAPGEPDDAILRRHRLSFPYILTVGTLEPRKNHRRLIQAFTYLVQQERIPHHLVIAGARGWKDRAIYAGARNSPAAGRIHFLGYVPTADLPGLYRRADLFAFPSRYEGFGLPVLEALACGTPVLISSAPALTEVAGHGTSVVVEPDSVEDIAAGLYRLVCDAALRASLEARGLTRAEEFSWDKCAAETYQLYREVQDECPHVTRVYVSR